MRRLRTDRTAQVIIAGYVLFQNLRRVRYEPAMDTPSAPRASMAFGEPARGDLTSAATKAAVTGVRIT